MARLAIFFVVVVGVPALRAQAPAPFTDLAQSYADGRHEDVARELRDRFTTRRDVESFLKSAERSVRTQSASIKATFLLEAAVAAYETDQELSADILQLAFRAVQGSPKDFELRWHRAVTAWLQGPPPAQALAPFRQNLGSFGGWAEDISGRRGDDFPKNRDYRVTKFFEESLRRFPDEREFKFAAALYRAMCLHNYVHSRNVVLQVPAMPITSTTWTFRPPDLAELAKPFEELAASGSPEERASALIYLGFFRYHASKYQEAVDHWNQAEQLTGDSRLQYLTLLFRSRVLWAQQGQVTRAVEMLRKAVTLVPKAQTAKRMLSTLLFLLGDRSSAGALTAEVIEATSTDDPWWDFLRGSFTQWPARLAEVRASLQ